MFFQVRGIRTAGLVLLMAGTMAILASGCSTSSAPEALPVITVKAAYPGAGARVVADAIATPIEQQVNGVDGLRYLRSRCANDGTYTLHVVFQPGVDLNQAQVLVQNRVARAQPVLPNAVAKCGVTITKTPPCVPLIVCLTSPDHTRDGLELSQIAKAELVDQLARWAGVAEVVCQGQDDYGLRVSLSLKSLVARNLSLGEVARLLQMQTDLNQPEQYAKVILDTKVDGTIVRLQDVARLQMATGMKHGFVLLNNQPASALAIYPTSLAGAAEVSRAIRNKLPNLLARLPAGVGLSVMLDPAADPNESGQSAGEYLLVEPDFAINASKERTLALMKQGWAALRDVAGVRDVMCLSKNPLSRFRDEPCILLRMASVDENLADRAERLTTIRSKLRQALETSVRLRELSGAGIAAGQGWPIDFAVVGADADHVHAMAEKLVERLKKVKELADVEIDPIQTAQAKFNVNIDRERAAGLGVSVGEVFETLKAFGGANEVGQIVQGGQKLPVLVQIDGSALDTPADCDKVRVRTSGGQWVPLSNLAKITVGHECPVMDRLDLYPMAEITRHVRVRRREEGPGALRARLAGS